VLLLIAAVLALPVTAHARTWRWPVRGEVVQGFAFDKRDPFAKRQHRGIEIAAAPGTRVRSACPGRVHFAGTVPRHGRTVSVTCGPLIATYLHLASVAVRRGEQLATGERLGSAGRRGLYFGVRQAADRFGYIDPLSLLPSDPLGPAPPPLAPGSRRPRARPAAPPSMPARIPPAVWAGLALLGLAVPTLTIARARGRARRAARRRAQVAMRVVRQ
jgi:murein DD-endopeptidase MepM/ murein hydrolase activator NlpD